MKPDKVTKFMQGTQFRLDRKVIFVEYASMTGELVKCRFDLSQKTEIILDDYKVLSFADLTDRYSKGEELFIKRVLYYEQECHMVIGDKLLIPTKVYFENAGYQQAYETNNKLLRNIANSAYGITSRDWADVLADSARYIHMSGARMSGKTLWLSNIAKSIEEDARNDAIERWLKAEPIKPIYFDTDMVMTREEMQYCRNDVAVTEKLFKEEQIMRFESCKPTVKKVIFNDPATIVMWSDGTKTVVKCGENDIFDPEKGVAMCCMKKLLGTNKTGSNYLDNNETLRGVKRYIQKWEEDNRKEAKSMDESIEKEFEAVTSSDWTVVPADENATAEEADNA